MLTARQQKVLQTIVEEYIQTPTPVSSDSVAQRMPLAVSAATVRSEMAELEEEGYVVRPHTSAGGVPSDRGYRAYLEFLGDVPGPSRQVQRIVRQKFQRTHMDVEAWSQLSAEILAGLVRALAICTLPRAEEARWRRLDMVYLQEFLALVVMVLKESRLKQQLVRFSEPTNQDQLTQISNKLNTNFSSLSLGEIQSKNVELTPAERVVAEAALGLLKEEQEKTPVYHFDGLRHMFSYPELMPGSRAREVAEVLEDRDLMGSLLWEVAPDSGEVRVTIGAENKRVLLRSFSVVFAQYGVPSEGAGVVGVIGPTRMPYASAISSVRYLSSMMSEMVGAVQGKAQ